MSVGIGHEKIANIIEEKERNKEKESVTVELQNADCKEKGRGDLLYTLSTFYYESVVRIGWQYFVPFVFLPGKEQIPPLGKKSLTYSGPYVLKTYSHGRDLPGATLYIMNTTRRSLTFSI